MNKLVKQGFQNDQGRTGNAGADHVRRPAMTRKPHTPDGWGTAVWLVELWLAQQERVDALLERVPTTLTGVERARCQNLFFGVVRWWSRLEAGLAGLAARDPRPRVKATLLVAGFELLQGGKDHTAQIVHHAVERTKALASPAEARLVNAVARKLADRLGAGVADGLAVEFSHPEWLVARWETLFGAAATRQLLEWNQSPAPVYARWRQPVDPAADGGAAVPPDFLKATRWPGYFEVTAGHWDEIKRLAAAGALYIQDPSTRICVELLAPQPGETILDACAAPGGKSLMIADALAGKGRLVALDEPGDRLDRLRENLGRAPKGVEVALMPGDLGRAGPTYFEKFNLPATYDAVLLDAPCSNTGVMRHRVDVKWRLRESDLEQHAAQQFRLLRSAARMVREGGRLVYSTCSVDAAENEDVVNRFTKEQRGWRLERHVVALPWVDGHDGAAAFLLSRR